MLTIHKSRFHSPHSSIQQTESDGNCLCHAASLGTWGVHDRHRLLRQAVRSFFVDERQRAVRLLRRAWEGELLHKRQGKGALSKEELDGEWAALARRAEEGEMEMEAGVHVFALAHVLRRPIVVFAAAAAEGQQGVEAEAGEGIAGTYVYMLL